MADFHPDNPLIVQGDHTILVEVDNPLYAEARDALARFAELVKSPEHIHTYRVSPLSIWNACAVGETADSIVGALRRFSKYPLPGHVGASVRDFAARYGCLKLTRHDGDSLRLTARDLPLAEELAHQKTLAPLLRARLAPLEFEVPGGDRGRLKQALIKLGFPTEDLAGYLAGEAFPLTLRGVTLSSRPFAPRDYQSEAADLFNAGGAERGGSGVIVLPCGGGKTIVGMACMALVRASTLILVTNVTAARQWKAELLDKTTLAEEDIGEYNGSNKEVRPVTIATYQILTHRASKDGEFTHFKLFDERNWGLIIYDEVHLLPAPVFQITASLQARRRLGLTATLVREDGREDDVFALIGPKKYDVPWKEMEKQGWIAQAVCTEIRLPMTEERRMEYAVAEARHKFRIASENPGKLRLVRQLIERHRDVPVLIIGKAFHARPRSHFRLFDVSLVWFETSGRAVFCFTLWLTLIPALAVQAWYYQRAFSPREIVLLVLLEAGLSVAWYFEGKERPTMAAYYMMQICAVACFAAVRRHLMLTTLFWNYEYDVWASLVCSLALAGAKQVFDTQPRAVRVPMLTSMLTLPAIALVWVMVHGMGANMALVVVGLHSVLFAYLGKDGRESPYNILALSGFVAFILMTFYSKLHLMAVHAYVIPVESEH